MTTDDRHEWLERLRKLPVEELRVAYMFARRRLKKPSSYAFMLWVSDLRQEFGRRRLIPPEDKKKCARTR